MPAKAHVAMTGTQKINGVLHDKDERDEFFSRIDGNGNGILSLAEIDGFVKAEYPQEFHHSAVMRAYKAADVSKDGHIERPEFFKLLKYLVYFQDMWSSFESIDKDKDGRLDLAEFKDSCAVLGIGLSPAEAAQEFAKCDADGGGKVLFEEFCTWCCHRSVGTDPLAKEAAEDLLRDRCAEQIREYLRRKGKGDHTEGVVKAFKKAQYEPMSWVDELEQLETEGILDGFLDSCKKKERREEAAKGGSKATATRGGKRSAPKHPPKSQLAMPDKAGRAKLFRDIDVNGNGGLSLAEIDKAVESGLIGKALNYPDFNHKPALMRAYKAADRSGDAFIQQGEFFKLLKYMVYFNNLWHKFEEIDSDHDRRINAEEFREGCEVVGLRLSDEEAAAEFRKCDADGGGQILFAEFCTWCADKKVAEDAGEAPDRASHSTAHHASRTTKKSKAKAKVAPKPKLTMPDKARRAKLFRDIDVNGNGGLSLAEIDKAVESGLIGKALNYPDFNHKPALMRAYKAADRSGDAFIQQGEFFKLLKYMVYFNNLWHKFEEIDSDHDRRINAEEFREGCEVVGLRLSDEEAAAEFRKCDADGGGQILFAEFCTWCAERHIGDGDSAEEAEPPEPSRTSGGGRPKKKKKKKKGGCCGSKPAAH